MSAMHAGVMTTSTEMMYAQLVTLTSSRGSSCVFVCFWVSVGGFQRRYAVLHKCGCRAVLHLGAPILLLRSILPGIIYYSMLFFVFFKAFHG